MQKKGKAAAQQLEADFGTKVISYTADITIESEAEAMAEAAFNAFGKIDILINSAGINIRGAIDELSYEDFTKVMNVNVNGTWLSSRAVTPFMKKNGSGTDYQSGQYIRTNRPCKQNAIYGQQRCGCQYDKSTCN